MFGVHFWRKFWKIIKNKDFGFKIWKRSYFKALFRHSTHKNENFVNKFKGNICLYIYIYRRANGIYIQYCWDTQYEIFVLFKLKNLLTSPIYIYPKKMQFAAYGQLVLFFYKRVDTMPRYGLSRYGQIFVLLSTELKV